MNEFQHMFAPLAAIATGALFSALWQGAVLAALVACALRLLPRMSAAVRSVIWLNVFILLVLLHFLPLFEQPASASMHAPVLHLSLGWSYAIGVAWLALSTFRAAQLIWGAVHLNRLMRRSTPVETDAEVGAILRDAPLGRSARLCTSDEVTRPSFLGFFRPRILVPPALVAKLTDQELRQVVLHEMEHLRRFDDWTNLLQKIGLVLFPLNPVLIWVERRLCAERELACDDRVISRGGARKAYALCLTRLAEFSMLHRGYSLILGAWERRPELVRRVQRILAQPVQTMGRKPAWAATSSLLTGAVACTLLLAHSPLIVSFGPSAPAVVANLTNPSATADLRALSQAMGGKPEFVKAIMPTAAPAQPAAFRGARLAPHAQVLHAVVRRRLHLPANRIASLNSKNEAGSVLVLTEWTGNEARSHFIVFSQPHRGRHSTEAVGPVSYAAVATPMGWLILQI